MRISDWSSDVCSSDLLAAQGPRPAAQGRRPEPARRPVCEAEDRAAGKAEFGTRKADRGLGEVEQIRRARQIHGRLGAGPPATGRHAAAAAVNEAFTISCKSDPRTSLDAESGGRLSRSEEHTPELQSLMRISYAVFCLKNKIHTQI